MVPEASSDELSVRGACPHDCPDTCAMVTTVDGNGRAVAVAGDPEHPITQGFLCGKVSNYLDRVYAEDRILEPLIRTGPKGSGKFRAATWEEAIDAAAAGIERAVAEHGGEAVLPYSYMGTQGAIQGGSIADRFMNAIGATELVRTICATAGVAGTTATHGISPEVDPEEWPHARYLLVWAGTRCRPRRTCGRSSSRRAAPARGSSSSTPSGAAPRGSPTSTSARSPGPTRRWPSG